jgi:hypothetical protein
MESKDTAAELRKARAAVDRRKGDVVDAARAYRDGRASGDGGTRRLLGEMCEAVDDLDLALAHVVLLERAAAPSTPAAPALSADAGPDAHGDGGTTTKPQGALDLEGSS